jgi:hypothetical protein
MARRKDGLDGRSTFSSRFKYHCNRYRQMFGDDPEDQDLIEHAALIAARIDRLRTEIFRDITDKTDSMLILLTRVGFSHTATRHDEEARSRSCPRIMGGRAARAAG